MATKITVDASQNLDISSDTVTLTGTSSPLVLSGSNTFTVTSSTVLFTGNGATGILGTTYNNLQLEPSSSSQQVLGAGTLTVNGDLTVGDGTHQGAEASTNNPIINVAGNTTIAAGATLTKGTGDFNFTGDLTITGTLTNVSSDAGTITVNGNVTGAGTITIVDSNATFLQRVSSNKTFGPSGSNDWTFRTLTFSNSNGGSTPITITASSGGSGSIITGYGGGGGFAIGQSGDAAGATTTLDAGNRNWILQTSSGSPMTILSSPQGVLTANTSTFTYEASAASLSIAPASYYNLSLGTTSDFQASSTFTLGGNTSL